MRRISAILFCLLLPGILPAEITIEVLPARVVTGLVKPINTPTAVIHFGDADKSAQAAYIKVGSTSKFTMVRAFKTQGGRATIEKIDDTQYYLTGAGSYDIEVTGFDPGIEEKVVTIVIGTPKPKPDNPDNPDNPNPDVIPPDQFNNIGQRVASWSAGLPGRDKIGEVYLKAAFKLDNEPDLTINSTAAFISTSLAVIPEYLNYKSFTQQLNNDLQKLGLVSRADFASYLRCVALGLGVKPQP